MIQLFALLKILIYTIISHNFSDHWIKSQDLCLNVYISVRILVFHCKNIHRNKFYNLTFIKDQFVQMDYYKNLIILFVGRIYIRLLYTRKLSSKEPSVEIDTTCSVQLPKSVNLQPVEISCTQHSSNDRSMASRNSF